MKKKKLRELTSISSPELLSVFLAGQKPRNLLICTKPLLKKKIDSPFLHSSTRALLNDLRNTTYKWLFSFLRDIIHANIFTNVP